MWAEQRNGKWRYFERYKDPVSDSLRRVSVTLDRKSDKKAAQMLAELIEKKTRRAGDYTLNQAIEMYQTETARYLRTSTHKRNGTILRSISQMLYGENRLDNLTASYIYAQYLDSGKSPGTCNESIRILKTFIRWCYRRELIRSTDCIDKLEPFRDIPHKQKIQDKYLDREELSLFLRSVTDEPKRLITEFLALSGLRIGEAIALNDDDVTDVIHVTKTLSPTTNELTPGKTFSSTRDVYIQPELADCIKRIRDYMTVHKRMVGNYPYFLIGPNGGRMKYWTFGKWFREQTEKILGRRLTAHSLRHTHASLLAEQGVLLETISRRLGHESSKITKEIYLHITEGLWKKDAEMMQKISLLPPFCPHAGEDSSESPIK